MDVTQILVISDDLTGALDTGIQFCAGEAVVRVGTDLGETEAQVLIVDAETRHLSARDAWGVVYHLARQARERGIPYVYKKTDSALRGNVGAELRAVLEACGGQRLHFVPAYPRMGRLTKGGVHYIDGCPVAESIFGRDPYEPVTASRVEEILGCGDGIPVRSVSLETGEMPEGILVYDCAGEEELDRIAARTLRGPAPHLLAGCAGLAAALSRQLGLYRPEGRAVRLGGGLSVLCGSTNPVTLRQMDEAEARGAVRLRMSLEEKLETAWMDTPAGMRTLETWRGQLESAGCSILESAGDLPGESLARAMERDGLLPESVRTRIARTLGAVGRRLLDGGLRRTLLVTGGDTLLAFLRAVEPERLVPLRELFPGVVCSRMEYRGNSYALISKSGGFGGPELLARLQALTEER